MFYLYGYQATASRYKKVLTYLKNRATTNQNRTSNPQILKGKKLKYRIIGIHPSKNRKEEKGNIESTGKQGLKWQ